MKDLPLCLLLSNYESLDGSGYLFVHLSLIKGTSPLAQAKINDCVLICFFSFLNSYLGSLKYHCPTWKMTTTIIIRCYLYNNYIITHFYSEECSICVFFPFYLFLGMSF